jgi:hypothetical protein
MSKKKKDKLTIKFVTSNTPNDLTFSLTTNHTNNDDSKNPIDFLKSIQIKYDFYFKNDEKHKYLITKALETLETNYFYHIIECSLSKFSFSGNTCKYCTGTTDEHTTLTNIILNYKSLIVFFCSYFLCPYFVANDFFGSIKSRVYTQKG